MLAIQSYEDTFESLPSGVTNPDGPIRSEPSGYHQGWLVQLLPYLDEGPSYRAIDFSKSVYDPANAPVRALSPDVFLCPSSPNSQSAVSDYAGCHHDVEAPIATNNQGVLFLNSHVRREDITDGVSHTLFVGEKLSELGDLGWMSGTRATLRNTGTALNETPTADLEVTYVGGFGSPHTNGANIGLGDGSVRFVSDTIDTRGVAATGRSGRRQAVGGALSPIEVADMNAPYVDDVNATDDDGDRPRHGRRGLDAA